MNRNTTGKKDKKQDNILDSTLFFMVFLQKTNYNKNHKNNKT
jgi:hypothetical protein